MRRSRHLHALADEELISLVREGDARAFELLYERHARAVFSLAYRIVGDRQRAEEAAQEAFVSVWRMTARYEPSRGSVRSWMLSITHNRAIDAVRRAGVHSRRRAPEERIELEAEGLPSAETEASQREEAVALKTVLRELPHEQSKVIELAYYGGFTHTEIGKMLDLPLGTVKSRMRRGLDHMREHLPAEVA